MLTKIVLLGLFAVSQAASLEPRLIQLLLPNFSSTNKQSVSSCELEKLPSYTEGAQSLNDILSPEFWMPYKLSYSQYLIDLINKANKDEMQQISADQNNANVINQLEQSGFNHENNQNDQFQVESQFLNPNLGFQGQIPANLVNENHMIAEEAAALAGQVQAQAQNMMNEAQQMVVQLALEAEEQIKTVEDKADAVKKEIVEEAEVLINEAQKLVAEIDEAAKMKLEEVAKEKAEIEYGLAEEFNILNIQPNNDKAALQAKEQIQAVANQIIEATEEKVQAITEEAIAKKKEILTEIEIIANEAEKLTSQIADASAAKIETIAKETTKLQNGLISEFQNLKKQAGDIAFEAVGIAKKVKPLKISTSFFI